MFTLGKILLLLAVFSAAGLFADGNPVHLRIKPAGAREAPPKVEDMLFMAARPSAKERNMDIPVLGSVSNGQYGVSWYEGSWKRPIYIAEYSGLIQIPAADEYVFYVRRPLKGPVYFVVNGQVIIDFRGMGEARYKQSDDGWLIGDAIHLEKGNIEYRVISFCERQADIGLRWATAAQPQPREIPVGLLEHADKLKFELTDRPVVYRAADVRLAGVPLFNFEDDPVRPELHVRSNLNQLLVEASVYGDSGPLFAVTTSVQVVKGWGRVEFPEFLSKDCERIQWTVRDNFGMLYNGMAKFERSPFRLMPDRASGNSLMRGSTNIFYVSKKYGNPVQPDSIGIEKTDQVVFLDGFAGNGKSFLEETLLRLFNGKTLSLSKTLHFEELVTPDETMCSDPMVAQIANLHRIMPAKTVILAPQILGLENGETIGAFERKLAVIAGMLKDGFGCEVILVTPPRDMLSSSENMRQYAVVIHRVADLYGLNVADIYSFSAK